MTIPLTSPTVNTNQHTPVLPHPGALELSSSREDLFDFSSFHGWTNGEKSSVWNGAVLASTPNKNTHLQVIQWWRWLWKKESLQTDLQHHSSKIKMDCSKFKETEVDYNYIMALKKHIEYFQIMDTNSKKTTWFYLPQPKNATIHLTVP